MKLINGSKLLSDLDIKRYGIIQDLGHTIDHMELLKLSGRLVEVESAIATIEQMEEVEPDTAELTDVRNLAKKLHDENMRLHEEVNTLKKEKSIMQSFILNEVPEEKHSMIFMSDSDE